MSAFVEGFTDELQKEALVGTAFKATARAGKGLAKWVAKSPWRRGILPAWLVAAGVQGAKAAKGAGRRIAASSRGPSRAWAINYSKLIGAKRKLTKLQREKLHRHFARYRERK